MDRLVIGCYHAPPVGATAQHTAAQQLWELLSTDDLATIESTIADPQEAPEPPVPPAATTLPSAEVFAATRQELLDAVWRRVATSPTSLTIAAPQTPAVADALPDESALEPDTASETDIIELTDALPDETAVEPDKANETDIAELTDAPPAQAPRWRTSNRGAAIGTATHRVLELVDLLSPSADEVRSLVRLACAEQQIPELQADIEGRVWSALRDDILQSALSTDARTLSEVYLVVLDGDRFLEGYIDLLVDGGPGGISILDYKTDRATSGAQIAAKQAHYAPQLAAYARAVEQVTGQTPTSTDLIFARPGGRPQGP
jgi:ATP-dependent helicase/nuclease subunit A